MRIVKVLYGLKRKLGKWFAYETSGFNHVYSKIDKIPGFLKSPHQEFWFFNTARSAPRNAVIVEVGSFKGRSTVSFGFGCIDSSRHVYAIDLFDGDNDMYGQGDFLRDFQSNIEMCGLTQYVTPIKRHSLDVAKEWSKPIDVLFIDGSHEYEDVRADFEAFYPFVKSGGIIALHDIRGMWDGVIRYWGEVKASNLLIKCSEVSSLGFGFKP